MTSVNKGLSGSSTSLSGTELLDALLNLGYQGTLALSRQQGSLILLFGNGSLKASHRLGSFGSLENVGWSFRFQGHSPSDIPQLASLHPGAALATLRALPSLGARQELQVGLIDFRQLLDRLRERSFSGSLSFSFESHHGLVLLLNGRVGAALFERDAVITERSNALRAMYRFCLEERGPLRLESLPPLLVRSLLGMALAQPAGAITPSTYSGLQATERGYTFYHQGEGYLHIDAELTGSGQRYAMVAEDAPLAEPELPDDPPGWEEQTFALTLRGQDALNPMTDLAMQFGHAFGDSGHHILDALSRGLTVEETATEMQLDLHELKPWLNRLQDDGLIREPNG